MLSTQTARIMRLRFSSKSYRNRMCV